MVNGSSVRAVVQVLAAVAVLGPAVGGASPIIYMVDQPIGLGSVTGTIETDGNTGALAGADIVGWNLELNGVGASINLTSSNSGVFLTGNDLTATTTALNFNFDGNDEGYLLFQVAFMSGTNYYCNATANTPCFQGSSVVPESYNSPSAQTVARAGNQVIAGAAPVPLPGAAGLLFGGLAALGALVRRWRTTAQQVVA